MHDEDKKDTVCYIGKVGVLDYNGNPITVDWRAPISSLYYDSNLGRAEYVAPEGIIKGYLNLKRQFDLEMGKLKSFQDVNTISNDELLKPYLSANADHRLKNIVSTIQSEQNAIIDKSCLCNNDRFSIFDSIRTNFNSYIKKITFRPKNKCVCRRST